MGLIKKLGNKLSNWIEEKVPQFGSWLGQQYVNATQPINEANMEYQKSLLNYQNEMSQRNVDKANWYNSPEMQMQRYQDAGLNPNLMYGNIQDATSSVASTGSPGSTPYDIPNFGTGFSMYAGLVSNALGLASGLSDLKSKESQRHLVDAQTEGLQSDNVIKLLKSDAFKEFVKENPTYLKDMLDFDYNIKAKESNIMETKDYFTTKEWNVFRRKADAIIKHLDSGRKPVEVLEMEYKEFMNDITSQQLKFLEKNNYEMTKGPTPLQIVSTFLGDFDNLKSMSKEEKKAFFKDAALMLPILFGLSK